MHLSPRLVRGGGAYLVLNGKNDFIRFHELLEFDGAIGGGGGGEFHGLDSGCSFAVLFVELVGGGACAKDVLDFCFREERGDVVRHNVFDACVASANDGATVENVPKGDVVLQKHRFFLIDRCRERLVQDACENFPEPVLRMSVVKSLFARFGRGNGTEQKNFRIIVEKCGKLMRYPSSRIPCGFGLRLLSCHILKNKKISNLSSTHQPLLSNIELTT